MYVYGPMRVRVRVRVMFMFMDRFLVPQPKPTIWYPWVARNNPLISLESERDCVLKIHAFQANHNPSSSVSKPTQPPAPTLKLPTLTLTPTYCSRL